MKILMMPTWYVNEHEKVIGIMHKELYSELADRCEVAVFVTRDTEIEENDCVKRIEDGLLTYRMCPCHKKIQKIETAFRDIIKEFQPDLIHGHAVVGAARHAVYLGRKYHIPVVISEHSAVESFWNNYKLRFWACYVYHKCTKATCVSEDLADKLRKRFPKTDFQVIYNGIVVPEQSLIGQKRNSTEKEIHICLVAALYDKEIKGIQNLIPAVAALRKEGMPFVLHIVGEGSYLKYFQQMAEEYDMEEACIFHGGQDRENTYRIMADMDFLVSASMIESFGCSIAEAMMLGKPVLVTNSGGPESFVNEECGIIVQKGSVDSLMKGLRDMVKKLDFFHAGEIHQYAFNRFNLSHIADQYVELYQKTIAEYRR